MAYPLASTARSGAVSITTPITVTFASPTRTWPGVFTGWPHTATAVQVHGVITPPTTGQMWPRGNRSNTG